MSHDSPIGVSLVVKGATVLMLGVVCGCLYINIRAGQVAKRQQIQELKEEQVIVRIAIQNVEADIKRNLAPRVLEARLAAYNSDLRPVSVEQTEALAPEMTASR
ncbi:MAG: hypothetical protein L7V86_20340 [Verrucomicrobiales bacterium]|jgi:hypothetical protein|nr:hypothetical protein [Verrucomicrobiales bacterium]